MTGRMLPGDSPGLRKQRGAFFTPPPIAEYLAKWGVGGRADAKVLDPTSGEGVFVLKATAFQIAATKSLCMLTTLKLISSPRTNCTITTVMIRLANNSRIGISLMSNSIATNVTDAEFARRKANWKPP